MRVTVIAYRPPGLAESLRKVFVMPDNHLPSSEKDAINRSLRALAKVWPEKAAQPGWFGPPAQRKHKPGLLWIVGSGQLPRRGPGMLGEHPPIEWAVEWQTDADIADMACLFGRLEEIVEGKRPLAELT